MPRVRRAVEEVPESEPVVLDAGDGWERRVRPARDGVVVEAWERVSVVALSADDIAMLYAMAERPVG